MAFLGIACPEEIRRGIFELVTFAAMKRDGAKLHRVSEESLKRGAATLFNKGTNGRWREVLIGTEIAQYERAASRVMESACKAWLNKAAPPCPRTRCACRQVNCPRITDQVNARASRVDAVLAQSKESVYA